MRARVDALAVRSHVHHASPDHNGDEPAPARPVLDDFGVLRLNGSWVALPPLEARLAEALLERLGAVTSRDLLIRAGWPSGRPARSVSKSVSSAANISPHAGRHLRTTP